VAVALQVPVVVRTMERQEIILSFHLLRQQAADMEQE
jgi:hypothetical protein